MPKVVISSVDEYIASQPISVREGLHQIRKTIRSVAPEAEEVISYQMPAFRHHGMLVWYSAFKNHYGFYPMPQAIEVFKKKLSDYTTSKGAIQFPFDKPLPLKLIKEITEYRVKENLAKELAKKSRKPKKK